MVTFVIPTLWKSDRIYSTIDAVRHSDIEGIELVIIDNANSDFESDSDKIRVIKLDDNIFVNPAWNIGVSIALNEYVCLLNDDIEINISVVVNSFMNAINNIPDFSKDFGILAYESGKDLSSEINTNNELLPLVEQVMKGNGFGQLMLFHKRNYCKIPEHFKVYFGDDLLHYYITHLKKLKAYYVQGLKVSGNLSVSSSEVEHLMQEELKFWKQSVEDLYNNYYKLD